MVQYIVNFTDPERTPFNVNSFTTDGPVAPNTLQLSSTAVRASTSLLLYGKGHPDYGERIQENLVNLMENFSGATEPTFPISGQSWFARFTYVLIDYGSPGTLEVYRWEDDSANPDGGLWIPLTTVTTDVPLSVDDVKTGTQPSTANAVDGSFWLDTDGSPLIPELYLRVDNTSSNLAATWLKRHVEDLTGVVTAADLTSGDYRPQKQLKVYDGVLWKNSGNVYSSNTPPQSPVEGDMWYNTNQQPGSPTNPQNQLFIWQDGVWRPTGYVDTGGDTMTGTLQFGLPTGSLFIWENGGNHLTGSDLRFVSSGLLSSDDNFYIHINNDSPGSPGADSNVFEVAAGSDARDGSQTSLFRVRADGVIENAQALGSPEGITYTNLIITTGDANSLVHRAYVDDVITNATALALRVTDNEAHIAILQGGGSPFQAKVNRSGDTMTGTLSFVVGGSPQLGVTGINMGDLLIQSVQTPQAPEDAANKQYVDDQVATLFGSPAPPGFNDGVVFTGSFDSGTNILTLNRTEGLSNVTIPFTFQFTASDVDHSPLNTPYLRDLFQETTLGSPLFAGSPVTAFPVSANQEEINETALEDLNDRLATVELPFAREIITLGIGSPLVAGGSPALDLTTMVFTVDTYLAGTNRLQVFVNGVKQYANERAWQKIQFRQNTGFQPPNLSSTSRTQLDFTTVYTLDIDVDGAGVTTVSAPGSDLQIFGDIVTQITAQTNATAVWNETDQAIYVYSNTTGTGSQINITDSGSPNSTLLGALSTIPLVGTGSGSPITFENAYTLGNISPTASGPISLVSQDLAYFEATTGSPTIDATFGEQTSTVVFNSQLQPGDVIELINVPVSG